jgi:hypothetical protein
MFKNFEFIFAGKDKQRGSQVGTASHPVRMEVLPQLLHAFASLRGDLRFGG